MFKELYTQLMAHLKRVDIHIPGWPHDTPCPDSPHELPFVLLCVKGTGVVKNHDPYDELTASTFTLANMCQARRGLIGVDYPLSDRPRGQLLFRLGTSSPLLYTSRHL